jgi:ATP-binding cassette subfamily B protein
VGKAELSVRYRVPGRCGGASCEVESALLRLVAAPVAAAAYRWSGRLMSRVDRQSHAAAAETADRLVEFARRRPALRAFGRAAEDHELLDAAPREQRAKARAAVRIRVPGIAGFALAVQLCLT